MANRSKHISTETFTGTPEEFQLFAIEANDARLVAGGLIKSYEGRDYDDLGNRRVVLIRGGSHADDNGLVSWSESIYAL